MYPSVFKPPISLTEVDYLFKTLGLTQLQQLELLIDIFEHGMTIDIYSRLSLDELLTTVDNRAMQLNYLIQSGILVMSNSCVMDEDDKVRIYNKEVSSLLYKQYLTLLKVKKTSFQML